jgi:hypothetical protein
MSLVPQNQTVQPNAVYASQIMLGMTIDREGRPQGVIQQLVLQGAAVDPETGRWSKAAGQGALRNIHFEFDAQGNITGLPADLAPLAPQIASAWAAIVTVVGGVNAIRKLV